jgi:hypothetical protein
MPGAPDPLYVQARAALLDALEALKPHLDAIVLVGAQAIYVYTGDSDFGGAEYTTDADLSISPDLLSDSPVLGELLTKANFTALSQPGAWTSPQGVHIDLMVPEALAGPGSRAARLGVHGKQAARRAKGLEGALIDRERSIISPLDPADHRAVEMWIAGPGALLVAKTHKIAERRGNPNRIRDKDALDVLRLLRAVETEDMRDRLTQLQTSDLAASVTREAIDSLPELFGATTSEGVIMAVRAAGPLEDSEIIAASLVALIDDLLRAMS